MERRRTFTHRPLASAPRAGLRWFLLVLLAVAVSGCALKSQNTENFSEMAYPERHNGAKLTAGQHEQLGDDLHERQSPEMAYMHYTRALASTGSDPQRIATLEVKKGLVLLSQGHDEVALKAFQKVLADHPDHALANEAAGAVYLKAGLTKEARSHFEKAAALDASLWRTQQYLGVLASRDARYDEAVRYFTVSLELRPGQAGTLNNLGVAHLMNSHYEDALAAFRTALAAGAPQDKTYNNIGLALARMGRTQEALQTFLFAGDESRAHNNLGYVLMLQGDNAQAIRHFEQAINLSPNYYAKAFANLKQARLAQSFQSTQPPLAGPAGEPRQSSIPSTDLPSDAAQPAHVPAPGAAAAPTSSLNYVPFQKASATQQGLTLNALTSNAQTSNAQAAHSAAAQQSAVSKTAQTLFGLHVASFRSEKRTARYVAEVQDKGVETMIMNVDIDGTRWHRVLAGRFISTSEAAQARPLILTKLGLSSAPIKKFETASPLPPQADGAAVL